jgi:hypothetical protein
MSIFSDLSDLMPDTIKVEPRTGEAAGDPTYGSARTITPCFVVDEAVRFRSDDRQTLVGQGYVIASPDAVVTEKDRLTLPARLGSRKVLTSRVETIPDETGSGVKRVIYG